MDIMENELTCKIDSNASTCPLLGGNAVFRARSFQATYNDSIYYDDQLLCNQRGVYYRLAQEEQEEEQLIEREKFMVYPNPNAGLLQIEINKIDGLAQFEIVNTLGQSILQWQHSDARQSLDLNKLQFSSGLYIVEFSHIKSAQTFRKRFVYEN
jgi:hypothetical protein